MDQPAAPNEDVKRLVAALHDGLIDDKGIETLERELEGSCEARDYYLRYVAMHVQLATKHERALRPSFEESAATASSGQSLATSDSGQSIRVTRGYAKNVSGRLLALGLATAVCLLVAGPWGLGIVALTDTTGGSTEFVAVLSNTSRAKWLGESPQDAPSRLEAGRSLQLEQGLAELTFSSGAVVVVKGPAELDLISPMRVRANRGTVRARVGEEAIGFVIETPSTDVVDLGTEFGVDVDESGSTDVVVFEGAVDLAYRVAEQPKPQGAGARGVRGGLRHGVEPNSIRKRLHHGEALHVDTLGAVRRIVAVDSEHYPTAALHRVEASRRESLIVGVSDNIRDPDNTRYYQIVRQGLAEDARAYVDRFHEWNGVEGPIPDFLRGADYVMTFNADKWQSDIAIKVQLSQPSHLYVFYDHRLAVPEWLAESFVDTGYDIGVDEGFPDKSSIPLVTEVGPGRSIDTLYSVWRRDVTEAGEVTLGPLSEQVISVSMYGVAATPMKLPALGAGDGSEDLLAEHLRLRH